MKNDEIEELLRKALNRNEHPSPQLNESIIAHYAARSHRHKEEGQCAGRRESRSRKSLRI